MYLAKLFCSKCKRNHPVGEREGKTVLAIKLTIYAKEASWWRMPGGIILVLNTGNKTVLEVKVVQEMNAGRQNHAGTKHENKTLWR